MSQAPTYTRTTGFADDERNNAGGRSTVRTASVDAELDKVSQSINVLVGNLALLQRDDGVLRDGIVPASALGSDTLKLLMSTGVVRGSWVTATAYVAKDLVTQAGNTYICAVAHTSGTFATDLSAAKWLLFQIGANPSASAIPFSPTANITSSNLQAALVEVDGNARTRNTTLYADFADTASAAKGPGLVGFNYALNYGSGTLGKWLKDLSSNGNYIGFIQSQATAILRDIQSKARESVSVKDFGAIGDNASHPLSGVSTLGSNATTGWSLAQWQALWPHVTALTNQLDWAASQAAVNTGKAVIVPDGIYTFDQPLSVSTANQRICGYGWGSRINFALAAYGAGIITSNSTGWQRIQDLYLVGVSNTSKVISIGSPDCTIKGNWIVNQTAIGHGIYQEDESVGSNIYTFDARIQSNLIYGVMAAGNYGIRLGLNHQGTKVLSNSVQNWGWHLGIVGATTQTTVMFNIFQRSDTAGTTPAAIIIHKAGSGMPVYNIDIADNYFEQNQVIAYIDDCAPLNVAIHKNYFFRNTANPVVPGTGVQATVYRTGAGTSAAAARIQVYDNFCDGYVSVFSLNNQYAANLTRTDNNTFNITASAYSAGASYTPGVGVTSGGVTYLCIANTTGNAPPNATYWVATSYATGTFSSSAYTIRQTNLFFGNVLTSGAFASTPGVTRTEFGTTTVASNFRWERGEYLESVQLACVLSSGSPTVALTLHQVTGNTDTVVASVGPIAANGTITMSVNAFPVPGAHYYLSDVGVAGGGTSYHYPYQAWIR